MRNLFIILLTLICNNTYADLPYDWQLGFQDPATPVMMEIVKMHDYIMLCLCIVLFIVFGALFYVCVKYHHTNNPNPSRNCHNTLIEIVWTVIPMIIVLVISFDTVGLINFMSKAPKVDMTVKVTGRQWYWSYEYPDHKNISFDSYMLKDKNISKAGYNLRLLEVDNQVVIPVNTYVKFLITSSDVIHSFAVPAFGLKVDAVPGRVNEGWVYIEKPGIYYGQCSELCGADHGFMPIKIEVVSKEEFEKWIASKAVNV